MLMFFYMGPLILVMTAHVMTSGVDMQRQKMLPVT